jgi:hypothetical protein
LPEKNDASAAATPNRPPAIAGLAVEVGDYAITATAYLTRLLQDFEL